MPKAGFSIDKNSLREFKKALDQYQDATEKETAEIINRAARNVAFQVLKRTPIAKHSDMRTTPAYDPENKSGSYRSKFHWALFAKKRNRRGSRGEVVAFFKQRRASRGFHKAGWLPAIQDLGGKKRGGRSVQLKPGGDASKGFGTTAKKGLTPTAILANFADNADKISGPALAQAVNAVARDMASYAAKRLQQKANKHSAK